MKKCGVCGATQRHDGHPKLLRCSACKSQLYCSVEHQHRDWPRHAAECTGTGKNTSSDGLVAECTGTGKNTSSDGLVAVGEKWLKWWCMATRLNSFDLRLVPSHPTAANPPARPKRLNPISWGPFLCRCAFFLFF